MKISKFDRQNIRVVEAAFKEKLAKINAEMEKEFGVSVNLMPGGNFGVTEINSKLQFTIQGVNPLAEDFKQYCALYGLNESDLNKTFNYKGATWEIVGLNIGRRKYPIVCKNLSTNKTALFPKELLNTYYKSSK